MESDKDNFSRRPFAEAGFFLEERRMSETVRANANRSIGASERYSMIVVLASVFVVWGGVAWLTYKLVL